MHGKSQKTKVIGFRVPVEVYDKLKKRAESSPKYKSVSSYVKDRVIYDTKRKHGK